MPGIFITVTPPDDHMIPGFIIIILANAGTDTHYYNYKVFGFFSEYHFYMKGSSLEQKTQVYPPNIHA